MDRGSGDHGVGGPCWRRCRTGWGHQGTATASSRARWRLSTAEPERRAGGAGGRRRGLASFAGQRFQPCPPPPCASGVGKGFLPTGCWPESPPLRVRRSVTYRWVQRRALRWISLGCASPSTTTPPRGRRLSRGLLPRAAGKKLQSPKGDTKCLGFLKFCTVISKVNPLTKALPLSTVWNCSLLGKSALSLTWAIS